MLRQLLLLRLWVGILLGGVDVSRAAAAAAAAAAPLPSDGMVLRPVLLVRTATSSRSRPVGGTITKLRLTNADTNQAIAAYDPLMNKAAIDLDTLPTLNLNMEAIAVGTVRSVVWFVDKTIVRVEQTLPWSFCGNSGLDFFACASLQNGFNATIQAIPYSGTNATGIAGPGVAIDLALFRTSPNRPVTVSLTLINADTGSEIGPLFNNTIIDLAQTPNINVRANVEPSSLVASVQFGLDGKMVRMEHQAPFAFHGNCGTSYAAWTPPLGRHTVTASAFGAKNAPTGSSTLLSTVSVTFVVVKVDAEPFPTTPTLMPLPQPSAYVAPVARNLAPTAPATSTAPPVAAPQVPPPSTILFPTEVPSQEPTMVLVPPTSREQQAGEQPCPVSSRCELGMNLMHRLCVTACIPNDRVDRKRRAGWVCGRC
jgi:hypothetical protein